MTKFGQEPNPQKLTVVKSAGTQQRNGKTYKLFGCECGNTKWIRASNVESDQVKSCGCLFRTGKAARKARGAAIEMRGKTCGSLKVIARSENPKGNYQTGAFWLCQCTCGNIKIIYGGSLRAGKTTSCGECQK